jgi:hypothetical protein
MSGSHQLRRIVHHVVPPVFLCAVLLNLLPLCPSRSFPLCPSRSFPLRPSRYFLCRFAVNPLRPSQSIPCALCVLSFAASRSLPEKSLHGIAFRRPQGGIGVSQRRQRLLRDSPNSKAVERNACDSGDLSHEVAIENSLERNSGYRAEKKQSPDGTIESLLTGSSAVGRRAPAWIVASCEL